MFIIFLRWFHCLIAFVYYISYFKGGKKIFSDLVQSVKNTGNNIYVLFKVILTLTGNCILITQVLFCIGVVKPLAFANHLLWVVCGTVLVLTGLILTYLFRFRYLGRYWSSNVEIPEQDTIVESGPYKIIRHPLYATAFLTYTGTALSFPVWWNYIACAVMITGYLVLTVYEDKYLSANLPGYDAYKKRTPCRFFPGIW